MSEHVILVDQHDRPMGTMEKLQAHREGRLHRAFSIFVFNDQQQLLLQRRHDDKYHSGGLWANTCCSHPRPDESILDAAHRRLGEEMGFDCTLHERFSFQYSVAFDNGLIENEYDHILFGRFNDEPIPNPVEVQAWAWCDLRTLAQRIEHEPQHYVHWLRLLVEQPLFENDPLTIRKTAV